MSSESLQADSKPKKKDSAEEIDIQLQSLSSSIGHGVSQVTVEAAARILRSAARHPDYVKFQQMPFVYEKLDGDKVDETVQAVVKEWEEVLQVS